MNRVQHLLNHNTQQSASFYNNASNVNSDYRFTVDEFAKKLLTKEQRDFYEENGYIIIRNLLPITDVNICNQRFDDLVSKPSLRKSEMLVMRDVSIVKKNKLSQQRTKQTEITKLQDFTYDEVFHKHYLAHPIIIKYCQAFIGYDMRSWHQMYINKPTDPGTLSSRHPLHQDLFYFPISNADRAVAVWTALQKVNRNNGGLCVIPGTHKGYLLPHDYPNWNGPANHGYVSIPLSVYSQVAVKRVHVEMNAGDCIFFHPLVIHGSSANLSNIYRRSLCVHFINAKQCGYKALETPTQMKYVQEERRMTRKRKKRNPKKGAPLSHSMDVQTYWKLKSRQIVGDCKHWALSDDEIEIWSKHYYKRKLTAKQIQMNTKN